ncbi:MAG: hypothetical protein INQ03_16585 [Candidatus Heimdallarchaeota archaeon]|nr:hypothetical protein [Candidatus Heimdallarchaeota archaeon]
MQSLWQEYFSHLDLQEIHRVLLYTDSYQEHITDPLLDFFINSNIPISFADTWQFESEDIQDMRRSFELLDESNLIITCISTNNPNYESFNLLFDLIQQISIQPTFLIISAQLRREHLLRLSHIDYSTIWSIQEDLRWELRRNSIIQTDNSSILHYQLGIRQSEPSMYYAFPGGQVLITPDSLAGIFEINTSIKIGADYLSIQSPIRFEIVEGRVHSIHGGHTSIRNLVQEKFINQSVQTIGFGTLDLSFPKGFDYIMDCNAHGFITLHFSDTLSVSSTDYVLK